MQRPIVGVMGSGVEAPPFAEELGVALACEGWHLLTGGGLGVMEAVSRGFVSVPHQGLCLGIMPEGREENRYVELAVRTPLGIYDETVPERLTRNHINVLTSDVVLILPGRKGTRNEAELCLRYARPAFLVGPSQAFPDYPPLRRCDSVPEALAAVRATLQGDQA